MRSVRRAIHEAHVVTVPGEAFGTRDHIRLSYATSATEIERGLERMGAEGVKGKLNRGRRGKS